MGFELDEWIYGKFVRYFKKSRLAAEERLENKVDLESIKPRLTFLARAITGKAITVFPAEREGGYKNESYFLPVSFALLPTWEENLFFYFYRTIFLSIQQDLGACWDKEVDDLTLSRQMAEQIAPEILEKMKETYPAVFHFHNKAKDIFTQQTKPEEQISPGFTANGCVVYRKHQKAH